MPGRILEGVRLRIKRPTGIKMQRRKYGNEVVQQKNVSDLIGKVLT